MERIVVLTTPATKITKPMTDIGMEAVSSCIHTYTHTHIHTGNDVKAKKNLNNTFVPCML